ncbi:MAG TPA: hypothetical protein VIR60_09670 [Gammaproteobacteria bacterium]
MDSLIWVIVASCSGEYSSKYAFGCRAVRGHVRRSRHSGQAMWNGGHVSGNGHLQKQLAGIAGIMVAHIAVERQFTRPAADRAEWVMIRYEQ